ncbi:MAG: hypothetical protein JSR21_05590 [Proteobacteria bacterium]|nr:hypothetical protein [Pseudomonadota bacterium]
MTLRAPASRLLPATIAVLALLLSVKSADLVMAAMPARNAAPGAGTGTGTGASAAPGTLLASLATGQAAVGQAAVGAMVPAANAATPPPGQTATAPPSPHGEAAPARGAASAAPSVAPSLGAPPAGAANAGTTQAGTTQAGATQAGTGQAAKPAAEPPIGEAERKVLLELRQRREELDRRDAALATREAVLAAAEHKLDARIGELQALQTRLEALDAARRDREEAGWRGLVKTYEAMKPRDAAAIFNDLDMPVLLQVMDRMKESKAAPVLAAMQVDKARALTAQLAQMRAKRTAAGGDS